jgi:hypothetical protein
VGFEWVGLGASWGKNWDFLVGGGEELWKVSYLTDFNRY